MGYSVAGRRLNESPPEAFLRRDWVALLLICLLAVAIRASVMTLLPSILHPDEVEWLEQTNRLVNHQGLTPFWDFQLGARSWLWPGLLAVFMGLGELFGSPPSAGLAGVALLLCIISLAPVICGFLWGRNIAGFPGAVITGLLNAVWFELVYFYAHPLSESFAGASLVTGLYLAYPGRGVPSERRMFIGAAMMGLAGVVRPQILPAVAVAIIAIGGIRKPAHYLALLGGLAVAIVLSGLLDWITWGWPFHATIMYVYYQSKVSSAAGLNPFYSYFGWEWVSWGLFGVVIVLCALYGALRLPVLLLVAATIFVIHSVVPHKEYRYISPALPLIVTLAGVGSTMAADWLADRLGRPQVRRALMVAVPLIWTIASLTLAASPNRIWFWVRSRGSILAMRAVDADSKACGVGVYPGDMWWRADGYVNLRPGIPLYDAGDAATPIAPDAYDYVLSIQQRSKESGDSPLDLPANFESLGYQQVKCWTDPYDRAMSMERTCLWRRAGTCKSKSGKLLTPDAGAEFKALLSR